MGTSGSEPVSRPIDVSEAMSANARHLRGIADALDRSDCAVVAVGHLSPELAATLFAGKLFYIIRVDDRVVSVAFGLELQ